jgi:protease I
VNSRTAANAEVALEETMEQTLKGKMVAILATDGFEQAELLEPRKALEAVGAKTKVISPQRGKIKGWNEKNWGEEVSVDLPLEKASAEDFDALVLPGGVMNPDKLRTIPEAVQFVRRFFEADKPVAAICHGPWMLVEAGAVKGRTLTSWPSLQTDVRNAGGQWVDKEVVEDRGLITSRKPSDIPAFNRAVIEAIATGVPHVATS